jgi:hypothetical protein
MQTHPGGYQSDKRAFVTIGPNDWTLHKHLTFQVAASFAANKARRQDYT